MLLNICMLLNVVVVDNDNKVSTWRDYASNIACLLFAVEI